MPKHRHKIGTNEFYNREKFDEGMKKKKTNHPFSNIKSQPEGGDKPHNNMPPYYVLAWIMKKY